MPIAAFARIFAAWVRWFNTEHRHRGVGGRTPLQVWHGDPTPIRTIRAADLRDLLLVRHDRKITSSGIRFRGLHYLAPEIQGREGQRVDIGFAPHDDRFIEVYDHRRRHLCTATPVDAEAHRQAWNEETRLLNRRRRAANARRRIQPLTDYTSRPHPWRPAGRRGRSHPPTADRPDPGRRAPDRR